MAETKIKTSAGMETASETVARAKAQLAAIEANKGKAGPASSSPNQSSGRPTNPVLEALTSRLTEQAKGISTSSSSNLQSSIDEAIRGTQRAGDLTSQRLQSERGREVSFARDRAGATYTTALEERSGYATQRTALLELTETTEKEIKDLDKRYNELIMSGDAETARTVAGLQIKKLEFQQTQEENFFRNLISVAGIQQQDDQFYQSQLNENARFAVQMSQSNYQFEKNLGVQYKQLDLQSQELDIARERNQISWAEYRSKQSDINKAKSASMVAGKVFADMRNEIQGRGATVDQLDPSAYANWAAENYGGQFPDATFEDYYAAALGAKEDFARQGLTPPPPPPGAPSAFRSDLSSVSSAFSGLGMFDYFTKPKGESGNIKPGYFSGGYNF